MRWSFLVLVAILVFDVWYRAHTFAPTVVEATGVNLWPATVGPAEPLDCDEAIYAHMGRRLLAGDVLYRDLTENKPPLGYWLYATPIALFGYNELGIRLFPIPYVLGTIALLWWIGLKLSGPAAGCIAAAVYAIVSTDPYLYGNGSNLEHQMNFFSVASLALILLGWTRKTLWPIALAGVCLGAATLVKQVAVLPIIVYGAAVLAVPTKSRAKDLAALTFGLGLVLLLAAAVLIAQGAGASAYDDIFRFGRAMATDTLPEPGAPSAWVRWLTGNADPTGKLPWPFGNTNYLVWWATGSWPLWLAAAPCLAHLAFGPNGSAGRKLVAAWTVAAGVQVVLPGLYWAHYYLLPTPGVAVAAAVTLTDSLAAVRKRFRFADLGGVVVVLAAILGTAFLQVRDYLLCPPQELTIRYKGGGQWVFLRRLGLELAQRSKLWEHPTLYVWGWQSPLHFYGKLDGASRHLFVDNLLRDQAERDHPLIKPRVEEILRDLRAHPPALIFAGYPPFPALRAFLFENYMPTNLPGTFFEKSLPSTQAQTQSGIGLWVEKSKYRAFEQAHAPESGSFTN
ncbi:MAG: glycosyltransferase family 39 protein [Paludisphaera borealis]|uniref:ArnT family glycosyltransferase n=1 Tax=Paludisphaera borealis TaxID=1387353 RepID=UPI0028441F91|nr:glycosyltransferase family 39 protein [Paludisphaera borealis]MDR3621514.1 glycosyltransferase family 39 protein [Paludisphaera borealis]